MGYVYRTEPARSAAAIVKSDSTVLGDNRGVWIGTGGDVALILIDDSIALTYKNVPSGTLLPMSVKKVMSTNTTASDMILLV